MIAGALDVWHTPIQMKKYRPGTLVSVLCDAKDADRLTTMLLKETSAFGVRRYVAERRKLQREMVAVDTKFGTIAIKLGRLDGAVIQVAPEFESCKEASLKSGVALKEVYEAARTAHQEGKFHK
jgi:pyridinium-3,5-bisthiocarboxylic acid mononucleotide nickel chelatase